MRSTYGACFLTGTVRGFNNLDPEVLKHIADTSKLHNFKRKDRRSGEFPIEGHVYIVHEGCVFLSYIDESGKKIILDILSKGDIFGDLNFNDKDDLISNSMFIEPLTDANVCELKKDDFKKILIANPEFAVSLLSSTSKRLMSLENKIGTMAFSDVEARLLAQMADIGKDYGFEDDDRIKVGLRVTHEKLGEMIGAARETVSEAISNLRNQGIISQDAKKKYILHKSKIESLF